MASLSTFPGQMRPRKGHRASVRPLRLDRCLVARADFARACEARELGSPGWFVHRRTCLLIGRYAGFNELFAGNPITEAACWGHVRRKFFDVPCRHRLADRQRRPRPHRATSQAVPQIRACHRLPLHAADKCKPLHIGDGIHQARLPCHEVLCRPIRHNPRYSALSRDGPTRSFREHWVSIEPAAIRGHGHAVANPPMGACSTGVFGTRLSPALHVRNRLQPLSRLLPRHRRPRGRNWRRQCHCIVLGDQQRPRGFRQNREVISRWQAEAEDAGEIAGCRAPPATPIGDLDAEAHFKQPQRGGMVQHLANPSYS